jgi:hypothetical protein
MLDRDMSFFHLAMSGYGSYSRRRLVLVITTGVNQNNYAFSGLILFYFISKEMAKCTNI